jgi:hypothetical protein
MSVVNIPGATGSTYTLVTADLDQQISCQVTAINSAGSSTAISSLTVPIIPATPLGWSPLRIGNGGFISGLDIAPDGTMVCRADSSGAFVWDPAGLSGRGVWEQMFTGTRLSPKTDYLGGGVAEVIVAKKSGDSNIIMATWGGYAFKSIDRGLTISKMASWSLSERNQSTSTDFATTKSSGPYGGFDPVNSNIVYLSTSSRGCRRTTDGGTTWNAVTALAGGLPSGGFGATTIPKVGTDTTSYTPSLGSKTFSANSSAFGFATDDPGKDVKVWSASNPLFQMVGQLTAASGTSFTINVDTAFGATAKADWNVSGTLRNPDGICGGHIVAFDTHAGTTTAFGQTVTKNVFVHTFGVGTFKSTDGGVNWTKIVSANTPTCIIHWVCDPYGVLWVVDGDYGANNIRRYDIDTDTWLIFTGSGVYFQSVAYDLLNSPSKAATTVTFGMFDHGIYRTMTDGGSAGATAGYTFDSTGKRTFDAVPDGDVEWLTSYFNAYPNQYWALGSLKYSPLVSGRLYMGSEGVWYSNSVPRSAGPSIDLHQQTRGIEEFIPAQIISPQSGVVMPSAWDFTVFRTSNFAAWPATLAGPIGQNQGSFGALFITYGMDFCGNVVAISLGHSNNAVDDTMNKAWFSLDYGVTWTVFPTQPYPTKPPGTSIACSNDGVTFVVLPCRESYGLPKITTNAGASWSNAALPGLSGSENWGYQQFYFPEVKLIESDKSTGDIYIHCVNDGTGKAVMFKWTKSTGLWTRVNANMGLSFSYLLPQFKSVPGNAGHFIFPGGQTGAPLYSTNDGWATVKTVPGFTWAHTVGIAKGTGSYPAIMIYGTRGGVDSYWLCEDFNPSTGTGTWVDKGATAYSLALPKDMCGDLNIAGQFYTWTSNGAMVYKS